MSSVTIRYESAYNSMLTNPFEVGVRHFQVAFCDGTQDTLLRLAKERVIYRPFEEHKNTYASLSLCDRVCHFTTGLLETVGYMIPVIPLVTQFFDRFNKRWFPKGGPTYRTHIQEGGTQDQFHTGYRPNGLNLYLRRNPFDANANLDAFYKDATWMKKPN